MRSSSVVESKQEPSSPVLQGTGPVENILSYLNNDELKAAKNACRDWKHTIEHSVRDHFYRHDLIEQYQYFQKLDPVLKHMIRHHLIDMHQVEEIKKLFSVLKLQPGARFTHLFPTMRLSDQDAINRSFLSDVGIGLFLLGYVPRESFRYQQILCQRYSALILATGLLTRDFLQKCDELDRALTQPLLISICCKNGYIALRDKLISPDDIFNYFKLIVNFSNFSTNPGQVLSNFLDMLLSDNGLKLIKKKIISSNLITSVDINILSKLLTDKKVVKIFESFIEQTHFEMKALTQEKLECLLTPEGLQALADRIITSEDITQRKNLEILKFPNGVIALREGLITLEQAERLFELNNPESIKALFSDVGLQALREKLITPEQAMHFYRSLDGPADNLENLLSPTGLAALRARLIVPEDAYNNYCLFEAFPCNRFNSNVLAALRYKLFSLKETTWSAWDVKKYGHDLDRYLGPLVKKHEDELRLKYPPESKEVNRAALTVQKNWRCKTARRQFSLFRDLQQCLGHANIHDIKNLDRAKNSIESGKFKEADKIIKDIKLRRQR